jgi:hypothetical protein
MAVLDSRGGIGAAVTGRACDYNGNSLSVLEMDLADSREAPSFTC